MASFVLLSGCKKVLNLDLENKSGTIVIEGNVTHQPGPYYVRVTRSVPFTAMNQYPAISNAVAMISDNKGQKDTLQYVSDGRYKTNRLVTIPGNTYRLQMMSDGLSYVAESTMPETVELNGLVLDSFKFGATTSYSLLPVFTDPLSLGDRYLFILSVNGAKERTFQTFSDNFNNGKVNQRPLIIPANGDKDVKIGDTIHVEMQSIDQNIYTYYTALDEISNSGGPGGSVTPANPPGNISNGALGYFSAHTSIVRIVVIK